MECKYTKYEKPRIIGTRANQLAAGAPPAVDIWNLDDAISIALKEWDEEKIPLTLVRVLPGGREVTVDLAKGGQE